MQISSHAPAADVPRHVHVERLNPVGTGSHSYLVADLWRGEAVIVDPVDVFVGAYLARLERAELRLVAVVDTHTHADHVSGAPRLRHVTGAPIVMHHEAPRACVTRRVHDGDEIAIGALRMRVLATPGHTSDGISLLVGDVLFAGDVLSVGARGHADEDCADPEALRESLRLLGRLPSTTRVYGTREDGHEPLGLALARAEEASTRTAPRARSRFGQDVQLPTDPMTFRVLEANLACDAPTEPELGQVVAVRRLDVDDLAAALRSDAPPIVVDVRSPAEFFDGALGRIPGSLLIPLEHLAAELESLRSMEAPVVVACRSTARALVGASVLAAAGVRDVAALVGGVLAWRAHGHPIEHEPLGEA